ncbi:MAG: penicillin-binding transpeptidase domain-containing protein [Bacillota bacterium]
MKNSIRRIFWVLATCLFLLLYYLGTLLLVQREAIASNPYNPRLRYENPLLRRGDILDCNGIVLAESVLDENGLYVRQYPMAELAVHITGYSSRGKTNIEAYKNFEMMTLDNEISQRIGQIFGDEVLQGNHISLTIDYELQKLAGELLDDAKGSIVVMEPSTGKVLALQSYPSFNPNTLNEDWTDLNADEDSPFLNRATQGLYPPGSTFKIITALSIMRNVKNWQDITYNCQGVAYFQDKIIHCYDGAEHGEVGLHEAVTHSCNTYFAHMAVNELSAEVLAETMIDSGIHAEYEFSTAKSKNQTSLSANSTESELVETSIGQGKTALTPLYMAMLLSGIANDGIMMQPYLVDHVENDNGEETKHSVPKKAMEIATAEETTILKEMLQSVVDSGTGVQSQISGLAVAGKTGTAQNATENDHSWFIAMAPVEAPEVVVCVMIENRDRDGSAVPIAKQMLIAAEK